MQQRVEVLAALRERTTRVTVDFNSKIALKATGPNQFFRVVAKGKAWHIVDMITGKTFGFCFTYRAALRFIDALELAKSSR